MDKFIVSARKYRPQNFETVIGQEHITTTLKNAIRNNHLAHAFLFCGPRGVGKTTCARILAKTINCENLQPDGEACNECISCKTFNQGTSLNIHELDAASNNSVEDIRTLTDQVRFAPQAGKYKVYIIDEVHMLTSSAFNAFLKTLEEPPPYAIFILATTEKHKILATILSRCQIFDFKRITTNDTVHHLQEICDNEKIKAEKAALQVIAQKSEGCMRDALSILDKIVSFTNAELNYTQTLEHLNILDAEYFFRLLSCMQQEDIGGAFLLFNEILAKGFESDIVIEGFADFLRNLLVCKDERTLQILEAVESFRDKFKTVAKEISTGFIISALNILNDAELNIKTAKNKRLFVEMILVKLVFLKQAIEFSEDTDISKKKILNELKSLSFKKITSVKIKEELKHNTEATLKISTDIKLQETKLVVEEFKPTIEKPDSNIYNGTAKLSGLEKIRLQIQQKKSITEVKSKYLSDNDLQDVWQRFLLTLDVKKEASAIAHFKTAELRINSEINFDIITQSPIQQKFIEYKRAELINFLHQQFDNRNITYQVLLMETEKPINNEETLTKKEQYLKIVEEYPLIKKLKDRLNMELDY